MKRGRGEWARGNGDEGGRQVKRLRGGGTTGEKGCGVGEGGKETRGVRTTREKRTRGDDAGRGMRGSRDNGGKGK